MLGNILSGLGEHGMISIASGVLSLLIVFISEGPIRML